MEIKLAFKKMSLKNGDEITLSLSPSAMQKMIMELIASGYLTTEELAAYIIGQLKICDSQNINHVLPENVMNKLIETYQATITGGNNV